VLSSLRTRAPTTVFPPPYCPHSHSLSQFALNPAFATVENIPSATVEVIATYHNPISETPPTYHPPLAQRSRIASTIHTNTFSVKMSGEAWLYLFAVLINAVNLFLQVFFTIMYSDLEWCVQSG